MPDAAAPSDLESLPGEGRFPGLLQPTSAHQHFEDLERPLSAFLILVEKCCPPSHIGHPGVHHRDGQGDYSSNSGALTVYHREGYTHNRHPALSAAM